MQRGKQLANTLFLEIGAEAFPAVPKDNCRRIRCRNGQLEGWTFRLSLDIDETGYWSSIWDTGAALRRITAYYGERLTR